MIFDVSQVFFYSWGILTVDYMMILLLIFTGGFIFAHQAYIKHTGSCSEIVALHFHG